MENGNVLHFSAPKGVLARVSMTAVTYAGSAGEVQIADHALIRIRFKSFSPRGSHIKHIRHLRTRTREGVDRTCSWYLEPARTRLASFIEKDGRKLQCRTSHGRRQGEGT